MEGRLKAHASGFVLRKAISRALKGEKCKKLVVETASSQFLASGNETEDSMILKCRI
jgi:hypothetical protein